MPLEPSTTPRHILTVSEENYGLTIEENNWDLTLAYAAISVVPNNITSATTSNGTANLSISNVTTATATVSGTLSANHIHGNLAGSVYAHVRAGENLAKGDPVYISGFNQGSGYAIVSKADSSNASKMPAVGIMDAALTHNNDGHMVIGGTITDLNTNAFAINTVLYVGTGGTLLTSTPPAANSQPVAIVERSNQNNGAIIVTIGNVASSTATNNTLVRRNTTGGASFSGLTISSFTSGNVVTVTTGGAFTTTQRSGIDTRSTFPPATHTHIAANITDFTGAVQAAAPDAITTGVTATDIIGILIGDGSTVNSATSGVDYLSSGAEVSIALDNYYGNQSWAIHEQCTEGTTHPNDHLIYDTSLIVLTLIDYTNNEPFDTGLTYAGDYNGYPSYTYSGNPYDPSFPEDYYIYYDDFNGGTILYGAGAYFFSAGSGLSVFELLDATFVYDAGNPHTYDGLSFSNFIPFAPVRNGQMYKNTTNGNLYFASIAPDITTWLEVVGGTSFGATLTNPLIAGTAVFTSTTRPTSAGTGTPAATSLITANDAYYRNIVSPLKQGEMPMIPLTQYYTESAGAAFSLNTGAQSAIQVFADPSVAQNAWYRYFLSSTIFHQINGQWSYTRGSELFLLTNITLASVLGTRHQIAITNAAPEGTIHTATRFGLAIEIFSNAGVLTARLLRKLTAASSLETSAAATLSGASAAFWLRINTDGSVELRVLSSSNFTTLPVRPTSATLTLPAGTYTVSLGNLFFTGVATSATAADNRTYFSINKVQYHIDS